LLELPQVHAVDQAHEWEHSLEVHLPFLQSVLTDFSIVPLVVGDATTSEITEVLDRVWGSDETLIVISSDLSHYLTYTEAQSLDGLTSKAIAALQPEKINNHMACGRKPIMGLLEMARRKGLHCEVLDVRNSGDTAGSKDRVVGYGAYAFH
jgi:AmmeMemoRadiSam system protein B